MKKKKTFESGLKEMSGINRDVTFCLFSLMLVFSPHWLGGIILSIKEQKREELAGSGCCEMSSRDNPR